MTKLQPRHKKALITAYNNATGDLQKRYLREALRQFGVFTPAPKRIVIKKHTSKAPKCAYTYPWKLSDELREVVGEEYACRSRVVEKLWLYIKKNKLQCKEDKRTIACDKNLFMLFGKSRVSMFEIGALISKHMT